jgi:outer membrane protein OmpA-like peptidoglycan-associated protein
MKIMMNRGIFILSCLVFLCYHGARAQLKLELPVITLDSTVNSPRDEVKPILSPDGKRLYFTRRNSAENVGGKKDRGDIWYTELQDDGTWGMAQNAGSPLNNRFENAVIGFSADGSLILLENYYPENTTDKITTQAISMAEKKGNGWSFPQKMPVNFYFNRSEDQHVSLSADRRIMLLCLESYGTYGVEDIYVSFLKQDKSWSEPLNLGIRINTSGQELSSFLMPDNKTMVFSTNGRNGFGSQDLFVTERLDDSWKNWSEPRNLGEAVNSPGREYYFYLLPGSQQAYFASTRNSDGFADLRMVKIAPEDVPEVVAENTETISLPEMPEVKEPVVPEQEPEPEETQVEEEPVQAVEEVSVYSMSGKVVSTENQQPLKAKISIQPTQQADFRNVQTDSINGDYEFILPEAGSYQVKVNAKGYMSTEENVVISSVGDFSKTFELEPLEVGKTFRLNNVLFKRGTTELIDSSFAELNRVAEILEENPGIEIELAGHTDNQGSSRLNVKLSRERVEVVKQYLVDRGVEEKRIEGKGYGGSKPIASNKSEETRSLNRRVEFTILKNTN